VCTALRNIRFEYSAVASSPPPVNLPLALNKTVHITILSLHVNLLYCCMYAHKSYLIDVYPSPRLGAGSWSLRALRLESDWRPLVKTANFSSRNFGAQVVENFRCTERPTPIGGRERGRQGPYGDPGPEASASPAWWMIRTCQDSLDTLPPNSNSWKVHWSRGGEYGVVWASCGYLHTASVSVFLVILFSTKLM